VRSRRTLSAGRGSCRDDWVVREIKGSGGGPRLNSLSYVSSTVGWVVLGQPGQGGVTGLLRTSDAGVIWQRLGF